jgi:hypothetical protein
MDGRDTCSVLASGFAQNIRVEMTICLRVLRSGSLGFGSKRAWRWTVAESFVLSGHYCLSFGWSTMRS